MPPNLLDLPLEVRYMIWRHLFGSTVATIKLKPSAEGTTISETNPPSRTPFGLLHVNRQLNREATLFALTAPTFTTSDCYKLDVFLRRLTALQLPQLRHIALRVKIRDITHIVAADPEPERMAYVHRWVLSQGLFPWLNTLKLDTLSLEYEDVAVAAAHAQPPTLYAWGVLGKLLDTMHANAGWKTLTMALPFHPKKLDPLLGKLCDLDCAVAVASEVECVEVVAEADDASTAVCLKREDGQVMRVHAQRLQHPPGGRIVVPRGVLRYGVPRLEHCTLPTSLSKDFSGKAISVVISKQAECKELVLVSSTILHKQNLQGEGDRYIVPQILVVVVRRKLQG